MGALPPEEQTLNQPSGPPLDGPSLQPRPVALLAQVRVDQQREWQAGRRVTVETLLGKHPILNTDSDAVVELAYNEFRLRSELGETPTADEYFRRFPHHASALRRQFALLAALRSRTTATIETPNAVASSSTITHQPSNVDPAATIERPPTEPDISATIARSFDNPETSPTLSHQAGAPRPGSRGSATDGGAAEDLHEASTAYKTLAQTEPPVGRGSVAGVSGIPGYELLGELGRGGMGVVLKARQIKLNRLVALKMILSGEFANQTDLHRFRDEAVQLARLQHPNIVQVYEVGEHNGRPFFAMEFMDGGSLSKLYGREPQPPVEAAQMIETLARAAHHAHTRRLIHRDLKPANILLSADGSPKITDFGLAKGLDSADSPTLSGAILGTPSYMAPEQASGHTKDVGPAADTYALGAMLYEALTGRPPFRGATALDTVRMVTMSEPVPPGQLIDHLSRDIETITLKCLQKDPAKRYASALEFAEDLRRFIENRPILARPVPAWEKAWKWAKRRPAAAALAGLSGIVVVGTAVGGIAFARYEHERAEENVRLTDAALVAKKDAEDSAKLAESRFQQTRTAVDEYFTEVSESTLLDEPGLEELRQKLLAKTRDYYAGFVRERGDDPAVRGELAQGTFRLAVISADLKESAKAIELFRQALAIFEELSRARPDDRGLRADMARTSYNLGRVYRLSNDYAAAQQACSTAVSQWEQLLRDVPSDPRYEAELARTQLQSGNVYLMLQDHFKSLTAYNSALTIRQRLVDAPPPAGVLDLDSLRRDLAITWDNRAQLFANVRDWPQAEGDWHKAEEILRGLVKEKPYRSLFQKDLGRNQLNLGLVLMRRNQMSSAVEAFRESVALWERLHWLHPKVRDLQAGLGNAAYAQFQVLLQIGQSAAATEALRVAHSARAELVKDYPDDVDYQSGLARCEEGLGLLAFQNGDYNAAISSFERAKGIFESLAAKPVVGPRFRLDADRSRIRLGQALTCAGQHDSARQNFRQALSDGEAMYMTMASVETLTVIATAMFALCDLERRAGAAPQALQWFADRGKEAESRTQENPGHHLVLVDALWGQAAMLTELGRFPEALAAWNKAIALNEQAKFGQDGALRLQMLVTLAQTDDYAQVAVINEGLEGQARSNGGMVYQLARAFALSAKSAAADARLGPEDRTRRVEEYTARAISLLQTAQGLGFFADRSARDDLAADKALDNLRPVPAFQKIVASIGG